MDPAVQERLVSLVKTTRPDLIVLTDDVYGTFAEGFRSLAADLPRNTILVYLYSKHFGCTGWRLGVIGIHQDNIFDEKLATLSDADRSALRKRSQSLTTNPDAMRFVDRRRQPRRRAQPHRGVVAAATGADGAVLALRAARSRRCLPSGDAARSWASGWPGCPKGLGAEIGYPVPLAITTVALSMVAYFFALFV
jgi:hypothetical protein